MAATWQNPVWPGYFADPFVLRWGDEYFAYGTGATLERDSQGAPVAFKILRSRDLVTWSDAGAALRLDDSQSGDAFWAPEVAQQNGHFYLYYSTAPRDADERHRIHVAVADVPTGPFAPCGAVLPETEGFCIDAHPFCDPRDGTWYLFFAKDYFDERTGTGLAVVPLSSDLRRANAASRPVLRPNADWQIYARNRPLYGRTWDAWHTVEGPCVVAHDGRYYCFYSGGNWQTHDYGVSYAMADQPLGPWSHAGESAPLVLRNVPGKVRGPGHNSYVIAPDGRTEMLVYHAWDPAGTARRMCLDRLVWTKDGPRCLGPSTTPQAWA